MSNPTRPISIEVDYPSAPVSVSGLLSVPRSPRAVYVLAHGAGAGMAHPFMAAIADGLTAQGVATLRYQFPYMESGSKRPDSPPLAHATVRAAVAAASTLVPCVTIIAGGKSFGGRMTSQAQAGRPMPQVAGLAFLGFPLHPAGKPSDDRAKHLDAVEVPMLFLQGTNDKLAEFSLLLPVIERLGKRATLKPFEAADHSFHVPVRSGRTDAQVMAGLVDALTGWIDEQFKH